jgi:hypothetical protein
MGGGPLILSASAAEAVLGIMRRGSASTIGPQGQRPLMELMAVVGVLTLDLWWLRTLKSPLPSALAAAILGGIVIASVLRRRGQQLASSRRRYGRVSAWRDPLIFTVLAAAVIIGLSALARTEPYDEVRLYATQWPLLGQLEVLLHGFGRALVQQVLLLAFLWPVTLEVTRRESVSAFLVAGLFGAAHLPNPYLAVGTLIFGAAWVWLFRRGAAFAALVVSHAILAVTAFAFMPERTLEDLHVGAKAVVRAPRYEVYEDEAVQDILRRACVSGGDLALRDGDQATALIEQILGRPATDFEIRKWEYRDRYLSRCAAAKRLLMSAE